MKKILLLIAFSLGIAQAAFADTQVPQNIDLQVDFQYQQADKNGLLDNELLKNNLKVATNIHDWMLIGGNFSKKAGNVMVLGNVDSADAEKIAFNFLVIKQTEQQPIIISQPRMIVHYGQKGEVLLKQGNTTIKLAINVMA